MKEIEILNKIRENTIKNKLTWYIYRQSHSSIFYVSFLQITPLKRLNITFNYYVPGNSCFMSIKLVNKRVSQKIFSYYQKEKLSRLYNTIKTSLPRNLPEILRHKVNI